MIAGACSRCRCSSLGRARARRQNSFLGRARFPAYSRGLIPAQRTSLTRRSRRHRSSRWTRRSSFISLRSMFRRRGEWSARSDAPEGSSSARSHEDQSGPRSRARQDYLKRLLDRAEELFQDRRHASAERHLKFLPRASAGERCREKRSECGETGNSQGRSHQKETQILLRAAATK